MSVPARASQFRRRVVQRTLAATAVAVAGSSAAVIDASAQPADDREPPVRTVTITPADRVELTAQRATLADELTAALAARHELVVVEPEPEPEPEPQPDPEAEPASDPEPEPEPEPAEPTSETSAGVWDRLAQCESGGNWAINTGNGFYGGLQFTLESWRWVGGTGYPHEASRETQIAMAERLLARQGWGAWPACSRKLGLQ